jgi:hypothetical protein
VLTYEGKDCCQQCPELASACNVGLVASVIAGSLALLNVSRGHTKIPHTLPADNAGLC